MNLRFFRNQHIRLSCDFQKFKKRDIPQYNEKNFIVKRIKNTLSYSRLGIIVTKKIGNSVERNRIRRILREVFRIHISQERENFDYLFIAKPNITSVKFSSVKREIFLTLEKLKRISQN